jgi:peroxiredoxin Q/BCP
LNTEIIGCSFDTTADSRRFAEKFHFPYALIPDQDRRIGLLYGAADSPDDEAARRIAYLIDEEGRILEAHGSVSASRYPREQLTRLAERS